MWRTLKMSVTLQPRIQESEHSITRYVLDIFITQVMEPLNRFVLYLLSERGNEWGQGGTLLAAIKQGITTL